MSHHRRNMTENGFSGLKCSSMGGNTMSSGDTVIFKTSTESKRNPHLRTKPLDQRRQELEDYIQEILQQNETVPQELLEFLQIRHFRSMSKTDRTDCELIQQCVVTFSKDPFFLGTFSGLPDVVVDGVLEGLYPKDVSAPSDNTSAGAM
ncbi:sorting nexin-22 isoform X2 [Engraulis encrasicolus]|uniref:sorting nexin-22 isoform X2 n=1 Tax=Engraulis encrasicolus TaxID=184585 RepID=UPI002FD6541D